MGAGHFRYLLLGDFSDSKAADFMTRGDTAESKKTHNRRLALFI